MTAMHIVCLGWSIDQPPIPEMDGHDTYMAANYDERQAAIMAWHNIRGYDIPLFPDDFQPSGVSAHPTTDSRMRVWVAIYVPHSLRLPPFSVPKLLARYGVEPKPVKPKPVKPKPVKVPPKRWAYTMENPVITPDWVSDGVLLARREPLPKGVKIVGEGLKRRTNPDAVLATVSRNIPYTQHHILGAENLGVPTRKGTTSIDWDAETFVALYANAWTWLLSYRRWKIAEMNGWEITIPPSRGSTYPNIGFTKDGVLVGITVSRERTPEYERLLQNVCLP